MQELDDFLTYLIANIDGSLFAALGSIDGLLVEQYPKDDADLSVFTAELTNVLAASARLNKVDLDSGGLQEVMNVSEKTMTYVRMLNDELFLFVVMNPSGNLGKARLYGEQVAADLLEMFQGV